MAGLAAGLSPRQVVTVTARSDDGMERRFAAIARLDGPIDVEYYLGGGILPTVLRRLAERGLIAGHEEAPGGGTGGFYAEELGYCPSDARSTAAVTPSGGRRGRHLRDPMLATSRATAETR